VKMRKLFALGMVAALSLTIALAVVGCGQKTESTETSTPPAESTMPADSGSSMMSDSGMSHMDTTATK
jgi:ABC-type oligopeptide transport system substrate-binding subunit